METNAVNWADAVRAAIGEARWAPSVHNTQPWSFAVTGQEISVRADTDRKLRVGDPEGRELMISCGAALFTLRTALRCRGFEPVVRVLPDPDRPSLVALLLPGRAASAGEHTRLLGEQIPRRRTHRAGFTRLPVPEELMAALERQVAAEGATLTVVREPEALAALTSAAQEAQAGDRVLSLEVARWARPPGGSRTDGVPSGAYPREASSGEFPQRDYARGHDWGHEGDQSTAHASGVVTLLTTPADDPADWVAAGQGLQRALLHASAAGVSAAFHTQALEFPELREFMRARLCAGAYPQMIIRWGVTFDDTEAVRRPLPEVLTVQDQGPVPEVPFGSAP
ncbi:hypothetical protein OIE66_18140 [Nonomuraea sp. NBC_01738]|uniref:Acg family FMN-binding oxidoreductase n=1 Tax=Nonomuraea sp. NBC_01738 TaxID=2976003 RepID=UPI002E149121|nr:hypothetical protein OIE66_18140 [Nonomuraea sp. NBC_01738]